MECTKMSTNIHWADRCLVQNPYYVGVCLTEKAYLKRMKKMGVKNPSPWLNEGASATVHTFENHKTKTGQSKLCAIVCFTNLDERTPEEIIGLIVHESVHIWREVKWALGEKDPSSEFMAYSIQNITQSMLEAFNRAKTELDELNAKTKVH